MSGAIAQEVDVAGAVGLRGGRRSWMERAAWCAIGIGSAFVLFSNLRFGRLALAVGVTDDFFYYLQVARNVALHGVSTFDGTHLTNGYHPLWMLVMALLWKVFGVGGMLHATTVIPFAAALDTVEFSLIIVIAVFAFSVLRQACSVVAASALQMLLTIFCLILMRMGVEAGLTLAVLFGLLWFRLRPGFSWSGRQSFLYGLIAGVLVLSRLDSMLFVGSLMMFDVLAKGHRRGGVWFSVGMWPVVVYAAVNLWIFHALLPVSGTAKQLRLHHLPSLAALHSLDYLFGIMGIFLLLPGALTVGGLILMAIGRRSGVVRGNEGLVWATLAFPIVHLLTIVTLSDWRIWPWYLYPWLAAGVVGGCVIFSRSGRDEGESQARALVPFGVAITCLVTYAAVIPFCTNPQMNHIYLAGMDISKFAESHPGIYAMGDRAGAVGYLVGAPMVQLEGLMMDKDFLVNIREQRDLQDVLKQYHVRYYIFTSRNGAPDAEGCFRVKEPVQGGPDSPTMRSRICKVPVAVFSHEGFVNDVFQMY